MKHSPDPFAMSGQERASFGVIATFENERGKLLTLHRTGPVRTATRQACAIAMARDESFRVVSLSTPATIAGDLRGRLPSGNKYGEHRDMNHPEGALLGAAGFGAILHPRLKGNSDPALRRDANLGAERG